MLKKIWHYRHAFLIGLWALMIPPTLLWWGHDILWTNIMSLYANIEASAAAFEANRSRKK